MNTPAQTDRAFAIADQAMFERLQSEAVPVDGMPSDATTFAPTDASYLEVAALAQASPGLREAVEWLRDRGYVELASDEAGECVNVLRRPGEEQEATGSGVALPRTDLEWFRLPEVFGKFVDYAERPVDENALRIIRACAERNAGVPPAHELLEGRNSQHVLKAEGESPDATDRENCVNASPDGGPMGVGQAAAAAPAAGVPAAPAPKGPCMVCGKPLSEHGSYPTCATHPFTDDDNCKYMLGARCLGAECMNGCVRGLTATRGVASDRGGER